MENEIFIIKRDGRKVLYDRNKIINAILKAMEEINRKNVRLALKIVDKVEASLIKKHRKTIKIEAIQDRIEELLMEEDKKVAKAFIIYRDNRRVVRESEHSLNKSVMGLLNHTNFEVLNENSNKNSSLASTQRDLIAGEVSKYIAKTQLLPDYIVQAHEDGVLHYHDMDYAIQNIHNCMLINLEDMLHNGTVINNKLVETPKSFTTACTVVTQIIAQIASGQYGGNTITIKHIAPFLRVSYDKAYNKYKEKYTILTSRELAEERMLEELKSGIQTIRYQLSTLHTSNGQSPFSTIYLEIEEGNEYEREMALICEEMIRQRLEGMKNYKGQEIGEEFPKLVYLLDKHNCLEGGKYDYITKLAAKCNTKRLVPDYQSAKIMRQNYDGEVFGPIKLTVA